MAKNLYSAPTGIPKSATPNRGTLAPDPTSAERAGTFYERKLADNGSGTTGPARFYEGLASDTGIPREFTKGAMQGYLTAPGRSNHNMNVYEKPAAETMQERAHPGSASWPEAPTFTGEFAGGADSVNAERKYQMVNRGKPNPTGARYERHNAAEVQD